MDESKKNRSEAVMAKVGHVFPLRGFTKPEGKGYVAICVDLDIVAQGKTFDEATQTCGELIQEYIAFVLENYPNHVHEYIPRPAPPDILDEYDALVRMALAPSKSRRRPRSGSRFANYAFDPDKNSLILCPA